VRYLKGLLGKLGVPGSIHFQCNCLYSMHVHPQFTVCDATKITFHTFHCYIYMDVTGPSHLTCKGLGHKTGDKYTIIWQVTFGGANFHGKSEKALRINFVHKPPALLAQVPCLVYKSPFFNCKVSN
jgi:hypothetical protein